MKKLAKTILSVLAAFFVFSAVLSPVIAPTFAAAQTEEQPKPPTEAPKEDGSGHSGHHE